MDNPLPYPTLSRLPSTVQAQSSGESAWLPLPRLPWAGTDSFALHGPSAVFLFSLRPPKIFEPKSLFFFSSTHSKLKGLVNRDSTERGRLFSSLALINSSSLGRRVCRPQFSLVCAESGHRGRLPMQTVCVGAGGHKRGREGKKEREPVRDGLWPRGGHSPKL